MKNTTTTTTKIQYAKGVEKIAREKTLENQRKEGDARTACNARNNDNNGGVLSAKRILFTTKRADDETGKR
ncbi:unnamed protein product [Sphagnum jensenii]|jgi:hypothetical protein